MSKISSFLTEYTDSLTDVRRIIRQMAGPRNTPITDPPVTPPQPPSPKVLAADEALRYFNLQLPAPDYLLKITPWNKADLSSQPGYRLSFITPTDYEIHDDDTVSTPDGQTLSREEFEKQQEAVLKSQLEQYLTSFPDYNRTLPSVGPDPHPEWPTTMEYIEEEQKKQAAAKSDLLQYLSLVEAMSPQDTRLPDLSEEDTAELDRYLDSFSRQPGSASGSNEHYLDLLYQQVRDVFGKVISQDDIDEMLLFADEDPVGFGEEILNAGRNEDSEALLRRMFPDITDEEIDQLFTPQEETPEEDPAEDEGVSGLTGTDEQPDKRSGTEEPPKIPEDPQELWEYFQQNGIPWLNIGAEEFNTKINDGYDLVENPDYGKQGSPDRDKQFIWQKPTPAFEEPDWYETLWRNLPINPYYWKSADEKNRMLMEKWAKEHGITTPYKRTEGMEAPAWTTREGETTPIPLPHTEFDPTLTPGERFVGEWIAPAFIPGGLARYPLSAAEKLLPKSLGKVSSKVLDMLVGKDTGSRLEQDFVNKFWENPAFSGAGTSAAERVGSALADSADASDDAIRKGADLIEKLDLEQREKFFMLPQDKQQKLLEDVYAAYEKAVPQQAELEKMIKDIAEPMGLKWTGVVKKPDSMLKKVLDKTGPKEYTVSQMKDHTRGSVFLSLDHNELEKVLDEIKQKIPGVKFELGADNKLGYLKVHCSFPMPDGLNGEIQIHTKEGWVAKKDTDSIYKEWGKYENQEVPKELEDDYKAASWESQNNWNNYWSKVPGGRKGVAARLEAWKAKNNIPKAD